MFKKKKIFFLKIGRLNREHSGTWTQFFVTYWIRDLNRLLFVMMILVDMLLIELIYYLNRFVTCRFLAKSRRKHTCTHVIINR